MPIIKTNNLGKWSNMYRGEALNKAMAGHNYGLQLWLYSLVLHNYLRNFLSDYSHSAHFGGVFYLFVRGMGNGGGVYFDRPDQHRLECLNTCFGVE